MGAGDVAAGINHHHERRSNRKWGDDSRSPADYRAPDGQNEEESPDEFRDVLVHRDVLRQSGSKKQARRRR